MTESIEITISRNSTPKKQIGTQTYNYELKPVRYTTITWTGTKKLSSEQYKIIQEKLHKEYTLRNIEYLENRLKNFDDNRTYDFLGIVGSSMVGMVGAGAIASQSVESLTGAIVSMSALGLGVYGTNTFMKDFLKTYSKEYKQNILETEIELSKAKNRSFYC